MNNVKKDINAINILIEYYKQFPADIVPASYQTTKNTRCPLCHVHFSDCSSCPWLVIEKRFCTDIPKRHFESQTTSERLSRLRRWLEYYEYIIVDPHDKYCHCPDCAESKAEEAEYRRDMERDMQLGES